ncbi:MAG: FtsH protease activity modulator HflK [Candidatus Eisenbacteria bacterium]|nr:FtsH protease activity modulator HflK [Candidatus Eisenbacteria bacterium]
MMKRPPAARIVLAAIALLYLGSGLFIVQQDEEAVVLLFGKPWKTRVPSGIHWAPPWPVGKRVVVRTTTSYQMSVGFKIADSVRGLPPAQAETEFLTGDTNILDLEMILQYVIDDPYTFAFGVEDPHFLVRRAAEAVATRILAQKPVDEVLTSERQAFLEAVRLGTQEKLRAYGAGIAVVSATLKRIEAPGEVIEAFQDVQNAKADRERAINEANGYASESLPRARGEAEALLQGAEGDRNARVAWARGNAERIRVMTAEYLRAPQITKERMYLETVDKVLRSVSVYVIDSEEGREPVGVKLFD